MSRAQYQHLIVFSSPSGSTAKAALTLAHALEETIGHEPDRIDLGAVARKEVPFPEITGPACLWIGSPVYAKHAVPPVTHFLDHLPQIERGFAVPFVTWGGVSSGTALEEMAQQCHQRGYALLGGAKILATHSSLWRDTTPLGAGRPDANDEAMLWTLVSRVQTKLEQPCPESELPPALLAYQPPNERRASQAISIDTVRAHKAPLELNTDLCTQCGICAMGCPTGAICLSPWPSINEACICCDMCRRMCPTGALQRNEGDPSPRLRDMAQKRGEKPGTRLWY